MESKKIIRQQQQKKIQEWWHSPNLQIASLYQQLFAAPYFQKAQSIAVSLSMTNELPTQPIIQTALQLGKQVYLPKTGANRKMEFFDLAAQQQFQKTAFGVWEPDAIGPLGSKGADLTIVPALAVALDTKQRLGFGAGYYDHYLATHPTTSVVLAIPPVAMPQAAWPVAKWDYSLDYIITGE
ncbi:MAG: 5-formyltetrahydrofolate cyclo-ligase [Bombilactobacillus mellis]|nr:5-formyltetrahydrofolate cyclo-ligase [Bombilactobacillus mellis]